MGAGSPTKLCEICEEAGVVRLARVVNPKRLCSTHYNRAHQPDRYKKVTVSCGWCGKACEKVSAASRGYRYRFCTGDCMGAMKAYEAVGPMASPLTKWHAAHPDYRLPLPVLWVRPIRVAKVPRVRAPHVFVGGCCHRCGNPYVVEDYTDTARYCSVRCGKRVGKQRYRARKKDAYVADVSPARIYERDGWRCKLCRKKVRRDKVVPHPLAPVLDHVVPLADGGTHEPANVQCTHFMCNSIKSDRGSYEQLALIG